MFHELLHRKISVGAAYWCAENSTRSRSKPLLLVCAPSGLQRQADRSDAHRRGILIDWGGIEEKSKTMSLEIQDTDDGTLMMMRKECTYASI